MQQNTVNKIGKVINQSIQKNDIYGASYSLIGKNENLKTYVGYQGNENDHIPLSSGMMYDLASVSKVIGTTTRIFQLIANNQLSLDSKVGEYLSDVSYPKIKIKNLLLHESGLQSDFDNVHSMSKVELIKKVKCAPLIYTPGSRTVYSDLNYILLGWIIEKIDQIPLTEDLSIHIFQPLDMNNTTYSPHNIRLSQFIPTEYQKDRGGIIRGQVHDYKAYLLDGVSGHAGLFSTLDDLSQFAQVFLNGGKYNNVQIFPEIMYTLLKDKEYRHDNRALGWDLWNPNKNMLWHSGFTGTSIALNLDNNEGFICLTNRIYPTRKKMGWIHERIKSLSYFFNEKEEIKK